MPIDLRSDTVTKPPEAMRRAMAQAEVGDDIVREDPTVNALEERTAERLGLEAALFVPSGHMSNQLCLHVHGRSGDCVIAHAMSHAFEYETGTPAALSGLAARFINTPDGTFTPEHMREHLRPLNIHHARNRIVAIENTHNRCGGVVWPLDQYRAVCDFAHEQGLVVHLDGARLWNACIASGTKEPDWTTGADSVNVCFSKGLGVPVGSALAGSAALVEEARFYRKMFGGQMRQAGIIAAGALYALEHHYERLAEDHANAKLFAEVVNNVPGLRCVWPMTNIIAVEIENLRIQAPRFVSALAEAGVLVYAIGEHRVRAVTHLDVSEDECRTAGETFGEVMQSLLSQA